MPKTTMTPWRGTGTHNDQLRGIKAADFALRQKMDVHDAEHAITGISIRTITFAPLRVASEDCQADKSVPVEDETPLSRC